MLVGFAKKNIVGKALQMPDQVQQVIRKKKTEGIFQTLEKREGEARSANSSWVFLRGSRRGA